MTNSLPAAGEMVTLFYAGLLPCSVLVTQSCPTLFDPLAIAYQAPLSIYRSRLSCPPPGNLPNPGIEPGSPTLKVDSLPSEPPEKPKNTGVGHLSLLQEIFPTQEMNWGLLYCRRILYQMSYQGSLIFFHRIAQKTVVSQ